jgi:hypothetical protein
LPRPERAVLVPEALRLEWFFSVSSMKNDQVLVTVLPFQSLAVIVAV